MSDNIIAHYILDGHTPVPCDDLITWAQFMKAGNRRVAFTEIGDVEISTVFLGQDHNFGSDPVLLFETMIFNAGDEEKMWRCSTWEQAEKQHAEAVALVRTQ